MDNFTLISGTKEDDVLPGTNSTDVILGKKGDDVLDGGAGNDVLLGGKGNDVLDGGAGNDLLHGGAGNDQLNGGAGNDLLDGGAGNDQLNGGAGNDLLDGGAGNDRLDGGAGSDIILAGKGDDTVNHTLSENVGAKNFYDGGNGFDTLHLTLTSAELKLAQQDIAAFNAFLHRGGHIFEFQSFDLTVRNFEALVFNIVDGNVAPVAAGNDYSATEDVALVISGRGVLGNDFDPEGATLSAMLVTGPANGSLTLSADGSFIYTPGANFFGEDSFTYKANDGDLDSNIATVKLQVAAVNDAPAAQVDKFATDEDVAVSGNVLANDSDIDSAKLTATLVTGPDNGVLEFNSDGTFAYTPVANAFGVESFTYQLSDGVLDSNVATVMLQIASVNDAPVAHDEVIAGTGGGPIHVAVVGGSSSNYVNAAAWLSDSTVFDIDATAILVNLSTTKGEWATLLASYDVVVVGENGLTSDYNGSQVFAALHDFVDAGGGVVTTGWFAGRIAGYGDTTTQADADHISPAAPSPDSLYVGPGAAITVSDPANPIAGGITSYLAQGLHEIAGATDATAAVLATDSLGRTAIAYDEVMAGRTVFLGSLHMAADAYNPSATRSGPVDQIFEQAVVWSAGDQGSGATTDEDTIYVVDDALLLANDTDVEGDALSIFSVSAKSLLGAAVSINTAGDVVYDPTSAPQLQDLAAGKVVDDSFDFTISDGHGGFDTATASLTVAGRAEPAGAAPMLLASASPDGGGESPPVDQFYFESSTPVQPQSDVELFLAVAEPSFDLGDESPNQGETAAGGVLLASLETDYQPGLPASYGSPDADVLI